MIEWLIIGILIFAVVWAVYVDHQKKAKKRRLAFIKHYPFPKRVEESVIKAYPHVSRKDAALVIEGLREYFAVACMAEGKMVSMPSQAVDVAWHEFLLFTQLYQTFCKKAFGHYFHHHPVEAMKSRTVAQEGIKRTWKLACKRENISPSSPHKLPILFAIDGMLEIPDGFIYQLNCQKQLANTSGGCGGYCASHIGCSGEVGGCGGDGHHGCAGDGCGGGCGGG